jgi:hypothetical protein
VAVSVSQIRTEILLSDQGWIPLGKTVERQALALMDHPNIAKVFDEGATESAVADPEGRARHSVRADVGNSEGGAQRTDAPCLSAGRPYFGMELSPLPANHVD